jgi:hypothetical protein
MIAESDWKLDEYEPHSYLDEALIRDFVLVSRDLIHETECGNKCSCEAIAFTKLAGFLWKCYSNGVLPEHITDAVVKLMDKKRGQLSAALARSLNDSR